jgi:hypothetical protein
MLSESQKQMFRDRGVLRLPGLYSEDIFGAARDKVRSHLASEGIWIDGDWCLDHLTQESSPASGSAMLRGLKKAAVLKAFNTSGLQDAVSDLVDAQPVVPLAEFAQLLFTLPNASHWTVPHSIWHLDIPRLAGIGLPGVQVFTFLEPLAQGGGGTLVVAGSHRLLNESNIASKQVKRRLKREPYFHALMSKDEPNRERFITEHGYVNDVELRVVELHGQPGDAFLTDMRVLHTLAPNSQKTPRIMLTQRFLVESLKGSVYVPKHAA